MNHHLAIGLAKSIAARRWQTIYLKASDILGEIQNGANIGTNTWMNWTGDFDPTDTAAMAPVRDRHVVSMLAALLNTNDLRSLFSVNNSNPNAWLVLLDGLTVLTNDLPDSSGLRFGAPPQFGTLVMSSNSLRRWLSPVPFNQHEPAAPASFSTTLEIFWPFPN